MPPPSYRPEIDGLRAIAVLAVVFFHAWPKTFPGGFVGVDIFFVISGYLMAAIVAEEFQCGTFSFRGFMARRVRRLVPALFASMFAVLLIAGIIMMPMDFSDLASEFIAQTLFVSNFFYWMKSDYFDVASSSRLLLHTWSLSLEFQYYLLFGIAALTLRSRSTARLRTCLAIGLFASFVLCVYLTRVSETAAFYLLPTRIWEFAVGAVLRLTPALTARTERYQGVLQAIAVSAIALAVAKYGPRTSFPGVAALLPCAASGLLIAAGGGAWFRTLSQWSPIRLIGLTSYSIYLVHWPVLVLYKYYKQGEPSNLEKFALLALTLFAALLSWKYIEQPFRKKRGRPWQLALAATPLLFLSVGLLVKLTDGLPWRLPIEVSNFSAARTDMSPLTTACRKSPEEIAKGNLCAAGSETANGNPTFLMIGDSFANALMPAASIDAEGLGIRGLYGFYPSCPPLLFIERISKGNQTNQCREFNDALATFGQTQKFLRVLLVARWAAYADGDYLLSLDGTIGAEAANRHKILVEALRRTIDFWTSQGAEVWIVKQPPEFPYDVPTKLARVSARRQDTGVVGIGLSEHMQRQAAADELFRAFEGKVRFIDPAQVLCAPSAFCAAARGTRALYRDNQHLTTFGASLLTGLLMPVFDTLTARP